MIYSLLTLINILTFSAPDLPPGTIEINGKFVDKMEVRNIDYREFLTHMKPRMEAEEYIMLVPDSTNFWYDKSINKYKPIVNISWEQAMLYCEWRSAMVQRKNINVTYRLMTPEEWVEVGEYLLRKDEAKINEERSKTTKIIDRKGESYYYLSSISKPLDRVYHYFDNVSEMTLTKGVAMGDNNLDLSKELDSNLSRIINYRVPNAFLGFRCIAEFN